MHRLLTELFNLSIAFVAIIGLVRFKKIDSAYYPFLICQWIGLVNEIISIILVEHGHSNALNSNIYILTEALLFIWLFKKWGVFKSLRNLFPLIIIVLCLFWITENFIIYKIIYFSSYFRIFYSFIIVLLSIHTINGLISTERKNILKNATFLLCTAFVIYFTFKVLIEAFWLSGLNKSAVFRSRVYDILIYINLFCNLIYALAALWMPPKQRFSLPS